MMVRFDAVMLRDHAVPAGQCTEGSLGMSIWSFKEQLLLGKLIFFSKYYI